MGRARIPLRAPSSSYVNQPPRLRRIPPIPLPPIEGVIASYSFLLCIVDGSIEPNDASALDGTGAGHLIVDPEVGALMRGIDWHIALGPREISQFDPLLDRRVFISPNPNIASSPTSQTYTQTQTGPTILIHIYTPGRTFPAPHTSHLSLRLHPHARVRDLFYEFADCLAGRVVVEDGGLGVGLGVASLSGDEDEEERAARVRVREAQTWRSAAGFTHIGTTSLLSQFESDSVQADGAEGVEEILFADFLNGDWVISDLTPINAPESDGVFSMSVFFKE